MAHRLTPAQRRVRNRYHAGNALAAEAGGGIYWTLGGRRPDPRTMRALRRRDILVPLDDGLVEGMGQTWRFREVDDG